jgi:hypothetical protein
MAVREDCRHYAKRTTATGEKLEQCRLSVNEEDPFACPEGCLFFEPRSISSAGWQLRDPGDEPKS